MSYITVLGAGSWGTTISKLLADKDYDVALWSYEKEVADEIARTGINGKYMPDVKLPDNLNVYTEMDKALRNARYIVSAIPTQFTRPVIESALPHMSSGSILISASKGIEQTTYLTVSSILKKLTDHPVAVLSGPSFAYEVARRLPTAVTLASDDYSTCIHLQEIFNTDYFRVYTHHDILGVELGGALKNVIAIASGIADGLGLGNNARAALITRGIVEMARLGVSMGAKEKTFTGLSGLGDLVLTCNSSLSRNFTVGSRLGKGESLKAITSSMNGVAEGVFTAKAAFELSMRQNVEMPIVEQIYTVLYEDKDPGDAVRDLMRRNLKAEFHG